MYNYLIILILSTSYNFYTFAEYTNKPEKNGQELLLCRKCGADVADSYYLFSKSSPGARKTEKQNMFGQQNVTVQTLVNPFGVKFEIVTIDKARCDNVGPPQGADSWFPGYTWRICACPHCGQQLGWTFESSKNENISKTNTFHGLIMSNILGENFTDSLIMMPKVYKMLDDVYLFVTALKEGAQHLWGTSCTDVDQSGAYASLSGVTVVDNMIHKVTRHASSALHQKNVFAALLLCNPDPDNCNSEATSCIATQRNASYLLRSENTNKQNREEVLYLDSLLEKPVRPSVAMFCMIKYSDLQDLPYYF